MRWPRINWTRIAENLAACDPYAAALMADASLQAHGDPLLAARPTPRTDEKKTPSSLGSVRPSLLITTSER
jgi:hypothetical protein